MSAELASAGVAALSRRLQSRELSPPELLDACLAGIDALDGRLGAFVTTAGEGAREAARRAEAEIAAGRWRGPLHGIPFALADAIDASGLPTGLGLPARAGGVAERDATLAARLADQGAILVGKVRILPLVEPAAGAAAPACRNPWDPRQAAGAPSPGSAAAVAAGLVPFAISVHGAEPDTAAAGCGVTALRPTYGVLSRRGMVLGTFTLSTAGVVARSAEDCALVLDALAGADPRDPSSVGAPPGIARLSAELPAGLRVGVVAAADAPEPPHGFVGAQEALRAAGALLAPALLPEVPWAALVALLAGAEGAVVREDVIGAGAGGAAAAAGSAADYVRAMRVRGEAQRALARLLERHDLLLAPAPDRPRQAPEPLACAIALGGLPAVTFPVGLAGVPVGARLVAPPLEDGRLLSAAAAFQARSSHHLQQPPPPTEPPVAAVTGR